MKRSSIIIVAGCLTALVLGLALAYPLLIINNPVTIKNGLGEQVVYAYFGTPSFDPNISGLYQNSSNPQHFAVNNNEGQIIANTAYDTQAVAYFIVLNVTNLSNQLARINTMFTLMGPSISATSAGAVEAPNPLVTDSRTVSAYPGWDNVLSQNTSRLIYLSGIIGALNSSYSSINSNMWIYTQVHGTSYEHDNVAINGVDYEQLPFQSFGQDHLYNNLVGENQTLIFLNEFDVSVGRLVQ
jgi:hypothetical protein